MRALLPRSLGLRLVVVLLISQVAAVMLWMLLLMLFSPYLSYAEPAALSSRSQIASSLRKEEGAWEFSPSPRLAAYLSRRPGLEFLVADDGAIIAVSSRKFAAELAPALPLIGDGGELSPTHSGVIRAAPVAVRGGEVLIVTRGDLFRSDDLAALLSAYMPQMLFMFAPALLAAVIVAPLAVRSALRGVRSAADAASAIDVGSLNQRLDPDAAPLEVSPFVVAINRLLERVHEGVRRREMFVANAAHELRTPVAVLSARIGDLPEGPASDALSGDVRRLTVLIDQLLSAARLRGDDRLAFEPVNLAALLQGLLADMAPLALRSGRSLSFMGPDAAWTSGDLEALRSALANLVDNALRAAPRGGVVNAEVKSGPDRVEVRIVDSGPGVAPSDREAVFEPFWRARSGGQGAGLGLAIVRTVARAHGGEVRVEETAGGGATFVLNLPAAPSAKAD